MKKLKLVIAGMGLLGMLLAPILASADVNNFLITSFKADETLTKKDPQGELHVVEHINVVFTDSNHGILRAIPDSYKHHSLQLKVNKISSDSGAPTQYSTYGSNGNTVLKIGDPERTVTGAQEYTIDYTLHNVVSFYNDHDELYWDVNGDQWQQTFSQVSVQLHLPAGLNQKGQPVCYSGSSGSNLQSCSITEDGSTITSAASSPLGPNQTLTYVAGFDKGYFQPSKWYETIGEYIWIIVKVTLLPIIVLAYCLFKWLKSGRDGKGRGTIIPQYDAPDGMKPLEAGTLLDFKTDNRDITATLIDLAIRKYIKIIETKQDKMLRKDKLTYELELINNDFSALNAQESKLLKELFTDQTPGSRVTLDKAKSSLYKTAQSLRSEVALILTSKGYFKKDPTKVGTAYYVVAGVLFFAVWILGAVIGFEIVIGFVLAAAILVIFGFIMPARTTLGTEAVEHIKGLKMYLDVAEKDRIQKLQGPDAQYAANAGEPVKTVELFEKLLPFAMVLGVEKQWAGQFEGLYNSPPDWYAGNWTTFNAIYLADALNNGIGSAVNSSFASPSSSGSSGFGGGGFSGGGGGGGGGGGW
jgi:uncharacterized membrane protein